MITRQNPRPTIECCKRCQGYMMREITFNLLEVVEDYHLKCVNCGHVIPLVWQDGYWIQFRSGA